jgi:Na+/proline symporter
VFQIWNTTLEYLASDAAERSLSALVLQLARFLLRKVRVNAASFYRLLADWIPLMLISQFEAYAMLGIFGVVMIVLVILKNRTSTHSSDAFLVANRTVSVWSGAFSIAVSWIWAPAIFICSMQSYQKGVPGIFWFTFPNILCFFTFVPLAIRLRTLMPQGYTLPEFIYERFGKDARTHHAFLIVFFGYQLGAIIINCLAGGALLNALSGVDIKMAILVMAGITLAYSLISGLEASIFTDVIQMAMVLGIAVVLVPWTIFAAGGPQVVFSGLGGVDGTHASLFDPWIAYTMGIPMTIGLIAGPIGDQMFFQRAMAVRKENITKTFVYGGLLFGFVPITLSLLGFVAASPQVNALLTVTDPQVVGAITVGHFLPKVALLAFCFMAFAGLASTLDSSFCAVSSLGTIDIYKRYLNPQGNDNQMLYVARVTMTLLTVIGAAIALLEPKLLWVFLIYGALASAGLFPTVFALFWGRLNAHGAFWAVVLSLVIGTPLSIYANVTENPHLIVAAAVASVGIGLLVCLFFGVANKGASFDYASLQKQTSDPV